MRATTRVVIVGVASMIIALAACGSRTGAQPTPPLSPSEATSSAGAWLNALKTRDVPKLAERTQFPFTYRTTNSEPVCEGASANAGMLETTVDCLVRRDENLFEELAVSEGFGVKALEPAQVPPWAAKLMGQAARSDRLVSAFINGDGITFEFVLVVVRGATGSGAIRSFLVNTEVEIP
jgi:hypothetical protein